MSPTDDERFGGVGRPDGDPPEVTLVERIRPLASADAAVDRTERDYRGDEGTVRMEPESVWGPSPPGQLAPSAPLALQAPQAGDRVSLPASTHRGAKRSRAWPGWVVPYLLACLTLVLTGLFVLWTQARMLGHF